MHRIVLLTKNRKYCLKSVEDIDARRKLINDGFTQLKSFSDKNNAVIWMTKNYPTHEVV